MSDFNPYQAPAEPVTVPKPGVADPGLNGLGGWLILVGIAVVVSPFKLLWQMNEHRQLMFEGDTWSLLTTPGSEAYRPWWGTLMIGESLINLCLCASWMCMNYLFFAKKKFFPKCFIWTQVATLGIVFVDGFAVHWFDPASPVYDPAAVKEVVRSLIAVAIWVPYMLQSKRVAATFVR